jgi:hypothetical protein
MAHLNPPTRRTMASRSAIRPSEPASALIID